MQGLWQSAEDSAAPGPCQTQHLLLFPPIKNQLNTPSKQTTVGVEESGQGRAGPEHGQPWQQKGAMQQSHDSAVRSEQ